MWSSREIFYVYALVCDKTDDIVYVGVTDNPYRRIKDHESMCKSSSFPQYKFFRDNNSEPRMEILQKITAIYKTDYVLDCESFWIKELKGYGFNIMNTQKRVVHYNYRYANVINYIL